MDPNSSSRFNILAAGGAFELVEFSLDRHLPSGEEKKGIYGVNVEKVREVVRLPKINPLASQMDGIEGIFELRGVPIPAINLSAILGDKVAPVGDTHQIIVTEFSQKRAGFIVSSTHRIRRISWEKIMKPASDAKSCICGMTLIEDNEFLFILDFEKIILTSEKKDRYEEMQLLGGGAVVYEGKPTQGAPSVAESFSRINKSRMPNILLVDDSNLVLDHTKGLLEKSGYNVFVARDGKEAQESLQNSVSEGMLFSAVVTDVEMPRMDGLSLTKWMRDTPEFAGMPIILHTSLAGRNAQSFGEQYGASGYVLKNDVQRLQQILKEVTAAQELL